MPVRVKICGTTNLTDALHAAQAGADAIGLIFAAQSKRRVSPMQARELSLAVGVAVSRVGVFMYQPLDEILRIADQARLSSVQIHEADDHLCEALSQYYPVLRVVTPTELHSLPTLQGVSYLLDAPTPGSGQPLDWSTLGPLPAGVWLAGGLGPENVAQAIVLTRPAGVDAVSRLECQPGVKDAGKVSAFIQAARQAATLPLAP